MVRKLKEKRKFSKKDFIVVDNEYFETCKLMRDKKNCLNVECEKCPFDKNNSKNGLHCLKNKYTSEISEDTVDEVLVESCKEFLKLR